MSSLAAAHVELPVLLTEMGADSRGKGKQRSTLGGAVDDVDLENMGMPSVVGREAGERDPLLLRKRIMSDDAIEGLKQYVTSRVPEEEVSADTGRRDGSRRRSKKVAAFYADQNERIDTLLKPLSTLSAEGAQEATDNAFRVKLAVNLSFGCNCILAVLQLYAAITSGSLALFATMVDSVFDPVANLILWLAHRAANRAEERKWPLGGSRFETAGNIVFAQLMAAVNLVLIVQSIREFVEHDGSDLDSFNLTSVIVVGVAFGVKLALFTMCFAIRRWSSQVQVLWVRRDPPCVIAYVDRKTTATTCSRMVLVSSQQSGAERSPGGSTQQAPWSSPQSSWAYGAGQYTVSACPARPLRYRRAAAAVRDLRAGRVSESRHVQGMPICFATLTVADRRP
jgi:hypothetical protein